MESISIQPVRNNTSSSIINSENTVELNSTDKPFIVANTIGLSINEIRDQHIIPVFVKDNEPMISHADFVYATQSVTSEIFSGETILTPSIRLSHPVKGRIPDAKDKPAHLLEEREKTIYYERMAFVIEIPSIASIIDGNELSLIVGGVKAYNEDNLYSRKGIDEHFKVFIGFQNKVCTNLCVWTDGAMMELKVKSLGQLMGAIKTLLSNYNQQFHLHQMRTLSDYTLTEHQFAQLIGRCRMYPFLPHSMKNEIPQLLFGDTQMGAIVKDFYRDDSFCRMDDGQINLWRLYNLFTGTNKSTYIDQFVERAVNASSFVHNIKSALQNNTFNWYLL